MLFEWDEDKRRANVGKHGIDFIDARQAFDGRPTYEYRSAFIYEERYIVIADLNGQFIAVVWTRRGENSIRIISARSARRGEKRKYRELHG